jgi:hypothetical protein
MIDINVELDEGVKTYQFPTSWSEVSVEQFSNLYSIDKDIHSGMFYTFEVIHQLTGIDRDIVEQIDYEAFTELVKTLKFIYEPVVDKVSESVVVDGEEYFLYTEFGKYTAGEIISIETILQGANNNFIKVMPQLLCIFLRRKTNNGSLEKYKTSFMSRVTKFKTIKIDEINHVFSFFLTGRVSSPNNTADSSNPNESYQTK